MLSKENIKIICKAFDVNSDNVFDLPTNINIILRNSQYLLRIESKIQNIDEYQTLLDEISEIRSAFISSDSTTMYFFTHGNERNTYISLYDFLIKLKNSIETVFGKDHEFTPTALNIDLNRCIFTIKDHDAAIDRENKLIMKYLLQDFMKTNIFLKYKNTYYNEDIIQHFENILSLDATGISLLVLASLPDELVIAYLEYIKNHIEQLYIDEINKDDQQVSYNRKFLEAGGTGKWSKLAKATYLNYDWIKASQVTHKEYNMNDLIFKRQTEFSLIFTSIDKCALEATGIVKVINGKASIKIEDLNYKNDYDDSFVDVKTYFKSGNIISTNIIKKLKDYFVEVVDSVD